MTPRDNSLDAHGIWSHFYADLTQINDIEEVVKILSLAAFHCGNWQKNFGPEELEPFIAKLKQLIAEEVREAEQELLEFAKDVIFSYGYNRGDGTYITGGYSTQEYAFSILRRHGLLNKQGQFVPAALTQELEGEKQ